MRHYYLKCFVISMGFFALVACSHTEGNVGNMPTYDAPSKEADWIRSGEPIEFQDELWFPQDGFDILLDSEVYLLGVHKDVPFFAHKIDIMPYQRLYTKFGRNKFRIYQKKKTDDKDRPYF